jgi:SAM-dependent methyltransferase
LVETQDDRVATTWKNHHGPEDVVEVDCPLCDSAERTVVAREWGLTVVRCTTCSLVYVSPRLRESEKNYYADTETKLAKYGAMLRGEMAHPRDPNYLEHWATIARFKPRGRVLDVGSHLGFFLRLGRNRQWDLHGVEPSQESAAIGSAAFGLEIRAGYLPEAGYPPAYFDIVTLVDVFEHVAAPKGLLREIHRIMRPGGVLFIKVPNADYSLLKHRLLGRLGQFDVFDSREHIVHYTESTLRRMVEEQGFRDATFYVPRPIQTGAWWQRSARAALNLAGRFSPRVGNRRLVPATDLALVSRR